MTKALALLLVPAAELWLLHALVVEFLGPNNTRIGFYSRDVLIPGFFALAFYLGYLLRENGISPKFRPAGGATNAILLGATFFLVGSFDGLPAQLTEAGAVLLLMTSVAATLVTACFVFLEPHQLLAAVRAQGRRFLYAVAAFSCLVVYARVVDAIWRPVAFSTGHGVERILRLFGVSDLALHVASYGDFRLQHPRFSVEIVSGCSGIEGVFFFLVVYALVRAQEKSVVPSWRREALTVAAGIATLFLLNVVRLAALVASGIALSSTHTRQAIHSGAAWLVHNQVSWALYLAAILAFFAIRRQLLRPVEGV